MNTKQVIVIRKDLQMRRGKEIAQASHASMSFLTKRLYDLEEYGKIFPLTDVQTEWLNSSFRKICVQVNSEEELLNIEKAAKEIKLECHIIIDNGLTEFHGIPTKTCLALGPDYEDKLDKITGHLKLY